MSSCSRPGPLFGQERAQRNEKFYALPYFVHFGLLKGVRDQRRVRASEEGTTLKDVTTFVRTFEFYFRGMKWNSHVQIPVMAGVKGYLVHKKQPPPRTLQ